MLVRQIGRAAGVLGLVGAALVAGSASAQAATPCPNWGGIPDDGSVIVSVTGPALGVVHLADGNCGHPYYDAILPAGKGSHYLGWNEVAAVYFGPDYGAQVWHNYVRQSDVLPSGGPHYLNTSSGGLWEIQPYHS